MASNLRTLVSNNFKEQRRTRELKRRDWRHKVRGYFAGSSALLTALIGVNAYAVEGGVVVDGSANINQQGAVGQAGSVTTVDQFTDTAIIEWTNFDIVKDETVTFNQPDAMSKVLNRVNSNDKTIIDGFLHGNGIVYVINKSGVYFHENGVVDTAGFVAAAGNITNEDFNNGVDHFTDVQGEVVNWGNINSNFVAMVGSHVANYGAINAPEGSVAMIAGDDVLLGEDSNGHIFARINGAAANIQEGKEGVLNAGTITADQVALGAGDLYSIAIYNTGDIMAGDISLEGQGSGVVQNDGLLDASNLNGAGGTVVMTGEYVAQMGSILASGTTAGGKINVGGGFQGNDTNIRNASATFVGGDATFDVNGGNGSVVVWADGTTRYYGDIQAVNGDVEVSGKQYLDMAGTINAAGGTILFDPDDIVIANTGTEDAEVADNVVNFADGAGTFTISDEALEALDGNITLQANNSISIQQSLSLNNLNGPGETFSLQTTTGDITSNAGVGISTLGGNVTINAGGNVSLGGQVDTDAGTGGAISITAGGSITTQAGSIGLFTDNAAVTLNATTGVTLNETVQTQGGAFTSSGTFFTSVESITTNGGNIDINHSGAVDFQNTLTSGAGTIDIDDAASGVTLTGNVTSAGAAINFGDNPVTLAGGVQVSTGVGAGDITFGSTIAGAGFGLTTIAGTGDITFTDAIGDGSALSSLTATGATIDVANIGGAAAGVTGATSMTGSTAMNLTGTTYNTGGTQTYDANGNTHALTSGGTVTITTSGDAVSFNNGNMTVAGNLTVANTSGTFTASDITGAGTSDLDINTAAGSNISVGAITGAGLVNLITSGAGQISVTSIDSNNTDNVTLTTGTGQMIVGPITTSGGDITLTTTGLAQLSGDLDTTDGGTTAAGTFAFGGAGGSIQINESLTIRTDGLAGGDQAIAINKAVNAEDGNETLTLDAGTGAVTVTGTVGALQTLAGLTVSDSGSFQNTQTIAVDGATGIVINTDGGANVDANITTTNDLITINADTGDDGAGTLDVADGVGIDTNGGALSVTAADLNLNTTGTLASDAGDTTITTTNSGTLGLGDTAGSMTISGAELQNITAANLATHSGSVTVNNITAANSNNISGVVTLNADAGDNSQINFNTAASTFNALDAQANSRVNVNVDLTTDTGLLTINSDANNTANANDEIHIASGVVITAATALDMTARSDILGAGAVTLTAGTTADVNANLLRSTNGLLQINATTFNSNVGNIDTDGGDAANGGNLDINAATVLERTLTIDTNGTGADGSIDFSSTIDGGFGLTTNSGGGTVTFNGAIGNSTALSALTINTGADTGTITFADNIGGAAAGVTGATAVGNTNTATLTFSGTTYNANQQTYTAAAGSNIAFDNVAGTTFTSSNDNITFATSDLALGNIGTLTINSNGGNISALDIDGTSAEDLTFNAGTGNISVGIIGAGGQINTVDFTAGTAGTGITLNGNITTAGAGNTVDLTGDVTLATNAVIDTTANNGNVTIDGGGTTDGNAYTYGLTIDVGTGAINTGSTTLQNLDHIDFTAGTQSVGNVTSGDGSGNAGHAGVGIYLETTTGNLTLTGTLDTTGEGAAGDVTLDANGASIIINGTAAVTTDGTADANITINDNIDGTTIGTDNLTLTAGSGTIAINDTVGLTTNLNSFTANATGGTVDINSTLDADAISLIGTTVDLNNAAVTSLTVTGDVGTDGGNLLIQADTLNVDNANNTYVGVGAGTQTVTFRSMTSGGTINVGNTGAGLDVTEATLADVQNSIETIIVGESGNTGTVVINAADGTVNVPVSMVINTDGAGGEITVNDNITLASGSFTVNGSRSSFNIAPGNNNTVTIDTSAGNGNVTINDTIEFSDAGADLAITTGNGNVNLAGSVVAETTADGNEDIIITSSGNVTLGRDGQGDTFGSNVANSSLGQIQVNATTGTLTIEAALDLAGAGDILDINNVQAVVFDNAATVTTTGGGAVNIDGNAAGTLTIGTGAMNLDGSFIAQDFTGISTAADITTTNDNITFSNATTLTGDITLDTDAAGGNVLFSSTLNGTTLGEESLTVTAGSGTVTLGAVGTTTALEFVDVTTSGQVTLNGSIETDDNSGTGNIDFGAATGGIDLGADITLNSDDGASGTGGAIDLSGSVVDSTGIGQDSLTITAGDGAVTFAGVGTGVALEALSVTTTGVTTLVGDIETDDNVGTGNVDLSGATGNIILITDVTVDTDAAGGGTGGIASFGSKVRADASGDHDFVVTTGDGVITLSNGAGSNGGDDLGSVSLTSTGGINLSGTIYTDDDNGHTGDVTITGDTTLNSSVVLIATQGGDATFTGTITDAANTYTLRIATDAAGGNVDLQDDVTIGRLDIYNANIVDLDDVTTNGVGAAGGIDIGSLAAVTRIDINGTLYDTGSGNPSESGAIDFNSDNIDIFANATFDTSTSGATGGAVTFGNGGSQIDANVNDAANDRSINIVTTGATTSGNVLIDGNTGQVVTFDGGITINGGQVTTGRLYTSGADAGTNESGGNINIDGTGAVSVDHIFANGAAGSDGNGGTINIDSSGSTVSVQSINSNGGGNGADAGGTIGIQTAAGGAITLNGDLTNGGGTAGNNITIGNDANDPAVTLNQNIAINTGAGAGNVLFDGTGGIQADAEGSNRTLTITAGTGNVTIDGVVGGTQDLRNFTVVSANNVIIDDVTTQGGGGSDTIDITAAGALTLNGDLSTDGAGAGTATGNVDLNITGGITLGGTVIIDTNDQATTGGGAAGAADGTISIAATGITSTGTYANGLTLDAGGNAINLGALPGMTNLDHLAAYGTTITLGAVTVDDGSEHAAHVNDAIYIEGTTINLGGNLTTNANNTAANTGAVYLDGNVVLNNTSVTITTTHTTENAGAVSITGTVNSDANDADDLALTIDASDNGTDAAGAVDIDGAIGGTNALDGGVDITGSTIDVTSITTQGGLAGENGGDVTLNGTGAVTLTGAIDADGNDTGAGGAVDIDGASISGTSISATGGATSGSGGAVTLDTTDGGLTLTGSIDTSVSGAGTAGNVTILVDDADGGEDGITSLVNVNASGSGAGNAGTVSITGDGNILTSSGIDTSADTGTPGSITVNSTGGLIDSDGSYSGNAIGGTANGGAIDIDAAGSIDLILLNSSSDEGDGGTITVNSNTAGTITITSTITSDTHGSDAGDNGGNITIAAANGGVTLSGVGLFSNNDNAGGGNGGVIDIDATGAISISNTIDTSSASTVAGNGGNVSITTTGGTLSLTSATGINTTAAGAGTGGTVDLDAAGTVGITDDIFTNSNDGNSGNVTINTTTGTITIGGVIDTSAADATDDGGADAGDVLIDTDNGGVTLSAGGTTIDTSGANQATTGTITVNATGAIDIDGGLDSTGAETSGGAITIATTGGTLDIAGLIDSSTAAVGAFNGGAVDLDAGGQIDLGNIGGIDTSSNDNNGGAITINTTTGNINIAGTLNTSSADATNNGGAAGSVTVDTDSGAINFTHGAQAIEASGTNQATGGTIDIDATGAIGFAGVISSDAASANAGNVSITTTGSTITSTHVAQFIDADSTTGNAGDIDIDADGQITMAGVIDANGATSGGDVSIITTTGGITSTHVASFISADTTNTGNGGTVVLQAPGNIVYAGTLTSTAVNSNGGSVTINSTGGAVTSTHAGAAVDTSVGTAGNGGAVNIDAGTTVSLTSGIDTSTPDGTGGQVDIDSGTSVTIDTIDSSSGATGAGGAININTTGTGVITLNGNLTSSAVDGAGGAVTLSDDVVISTGGTLNINSSSTNDDGGAVTITGATSSDAAANNLTITASGGAGAGDIGGAVTLGVFDDTDGTQFVNDVTITSTGNTAGNLTLNGNITLNDDGGGDFGDFTFNGGNTIVGVASGNTVTIDTEADNSTNGGNIDLGSGTVSATNSDTGLVLDARGNGTGGDIDFGTVTNTAGNYLARFEALTEGTGAITLDNNISVDDPNGTGTGAVGGVYFTGTVEIPASAALIIDTEQGDDNDAAPVDFTNATFTVLGGDSSLEIDVSAGGGNNGQDVVLGTIDGSGGGFLEGLDINTNATNNLTLNGNILLGNDGDADQASFSFDGDEIILGVAGGSTVTLSTIGGTGTTAPGAVDLGSADLSATNANVVLNIDTSTDGGYGNVDGGNVTFGTFSNSGGNYLGRLFVDTTGQSGTNGNISGAAAGSILVDGDGTNAATSGVELIGTLGLGFDLVIDTNQTDDGRDAGVVDLDQAVVGATAAGVDLTINTSTGGGGGDAANVTIGDVVDIDGAGVTYQVLQSLTVNTSSGAGTAGTLNLDDLSGGGTVDINVANHVDFSNATTVVMAEDVSITTAADGTDVNGAGGVDVDGVGTGNAATGDDGDVIFDSNGTINGAGYDLTIDVENGANDGDIQLPNQIGNAGDLGTLSLTSGSGFIVLGDGTAATQFDVDNAAGVGNDAINFGSIVVLTSDTTINTNGADFDSSNAFITSNAADNWNLTIDTTDGGAGADGDVNQGDIGDVDSALGQLADGAVYTYVGDVQITATDGGGAAGDLYFTDAEASINGDDSLHVTTILEGDYNFNGDNIIANDGYAFQIDTNGDNSGDSGDINLYQSGTTTISASAAGTSAEMRLDTTSTDGNAGDVTIGTVDDTAQPNTFLQRVEILATGATSNGTVTLNGDINVDRGGAGVNPIYVIVEGDIVLPTSITIDTEQGDNQFGGYVRLGTDGSNTSSSGSISASANNVILTIDAQGYGDAGGNVALGVFDNDGGNYLNGLAINTNGTTDGNLYLNGNISLDHNGVASSDMTLTGGGDVIVSNDVTIDTEIGDTAGQDAGAVNFGASNIYADAANFTLTIDTDAAAGSTGGAVTFGLVDNNAGGNSFLQGLVVDAGTTAGTDGIVSLGNNISTDPGSAAGGVTIDGNIQLTADVTIDTEDGNDENAGIVSLAATSGSVSTTILDGDLFIDTQSTGNTGGNVTLGTFNNTAGQYLNSIQINTAASTAGSTTLLGDISLEDSDAGGNSGTAAYFSILGSGDIIIGNSITVDTAQGADNDAGGDVQWSNSTVYSSGANNTLAINTSSGVAGENGGDVKLGAITDNGGNNVFLDTVTINMDGDAGAAGVANDGRLTFGRASTSIEVDGVAGTQDTATITINGIIDLEGTGGIAGTQVTNILFDTNASNAAVDSGAIDLRNAVTDGASVGTALIVTTSGDATGQGAGNSVDAGNIRVGDMGTTNAFQSLTFDTNGQTTDGTLFIHDSDNSGTAQLLMENYSGAPVFDVDNSSNIVLTANTEVDTEGGDGEAAGDINLASSTVSGVGGAWNLELDANGSTDGAVTLGLFNANGGSYVEDLTIDGGAVTITGNGIATDGPANLSVEINGQLQVNASGTVAINDDLETDRDANGDTTEIQAAGAITQAADTTIDVNTGVTRIESTGSSITLVDLDSAAGDGVAPIVLSGVQVNSTSRGAGNLAIQIRCSTDVTTGAASPRCW